jgi:hypothetical protein
MKPRLILVSLGLTALALLSLGLQAQEQPNSLTKDKDEIITSEKQLLRMFGDFQDALLRLKQRLARGNAEERQRAEVLDKVLDECKNLAINQEFTKMIELIRGANLNNTGGAGKARDQSEVITDRLTKILDMLRDSKGTRLSQERKDLKEILDKLNKVIQKQQVVQAITDLGKTGQKEVAKNQDAVTKDTKKIEDDIRKFLDKDKGGKGAEGAPSKGDKKDGGKGEGAKGEAKDAGKNKSSENAKAEAKDGGKESKDAKGETKPGQGKPSQAAKSDEPKSASKAGGDKGKEGSPDAGAKGDKKGGDKADKGAAKDSKGDKSEKGKEAGAKDAGKTGDPKKDSPQGAAKGGEDKKAGAGEPKQGAPDSKAKAGGGAGKAGGTPPPSQAKEVKGGDKGGEGKGGGEAKGGDGKQGETKPGDSKSGQGHAKDGGASPDGGDSAQGSPPPSGKGDGAPPPPPSSAGDKKQNDSVTQSGKKIEEAGYDQQSAEDKIAKGKAPDAVKKQGDAIKKMEEAKKKLEKLLQQMREEEIERVLAALQARCEKMLMMQKQVLAGTKDTHASVQKSPDKKPSRENKLESLKLSDKEKDIVQEANKCIDILEAEGSAVAFPEVFQQIRQDMIHVQKRLDVADVHEVTQGIEQDIIDTLKEMIDALKKARDDNQSSPGKPGQAGKPADPKLLELLQELKMVRSLQKRVNDRTTMYGKRFDGKEQAADPQDVRELRSLADRQMRIQEIVRRIAIGDNK